MHSNQAKTASENSGGYFSYFFSWIPVIFVSSNEYNKMYSTNIKSELAIAELRYAMRDLNKKFDNQGIDCKNYKATIRELEAIIRSDKATIEANALIIEANKAIIEANKITIEAKNAVIESQDAALKCFAATVRANEIDIKKCEATIEERDVTIVKLKDDLKQKDLHNESNERMVKNSRSTVSQFDQDAKRRSAKKRNRMLAKKISQKESNICKKKFAQVDLTINREGQEIVLMSDRLEVVSGEESSKNKQLTGNDLAHDEMHALSMGELLQNSGLHAAEIQEWKKKNEILTKRNTDLERYLASPIKDNQLLNELTCNPSGLADDILLNIFSMNEKATEGKVVNIGDELLQLHKAIHKISRTHRDIEGEYALILNRILNATVSVDDNMRRTQRRLSPEEFRHFRSNIEEMIGKYMDLKRDYNEMVSCR